MKNIKGKSIALSLILLSTACFAAPPKECPEVYAIKAAGLKGAIKDQTGFGWVAFNLNNYFGTENKWSFFIATNKGNNAHDAAFFASFILDDLTYGMGPEWDEGNKHWKCEYATYDGKIGPAIAITPPLNDN